MKEVQPVPNEDPIKPETRAHLEKAHKKLESAEVLLEEEFFEDSASRSYYAIFHAVVAVLRELEVDLSTHKHAFILNRFKQKIVDTDKLSPRIFAKIVQIKNFRESVEYSVQIDISRASSAAILKDARRVIEEIENYLHASK